jgi:hypothetical protein
LLNGWAILGNSPPSPFRKEGGIVLSFYKMGVRGRFFEISAKLDYYRTAQIGMKNKTVL